MKKILKKYNIKPSKKLGQNFLIDKSVLRKIIAATDLFKKDIVLEIGPGLGILTTELAKRVKKVIAVEKDKRLCNALAHVLGVQNVGNVQIVHGDVLRLQQLERFQRLEQYKLIANLPYYITSPVIRKFLETKHRPKSMILMVQKEVAQRIVAKPPRMNLLAVAVQFYAKSEIVAYVNKKSFWPQPNVDSAIIKIMPQPTPEIDTKKFFKIVKAGFSSKRKMLKNNLKIEESMLEKLGINPRARAENLSIKEWLKLYEML